MSQPADRFQRIDFSIIIPTYNRSTLLRKTCDSLCGLVLPAATRLEVIVCDDGSSDDTLDVVKSFEHKLQMRYCYQPDQGFRAAAARNMGIRQARGHMVFGIDSGVIVTPHFIKEHLASHGLHDRPSLVLGPVHGHSNEEADIWHTLNLEDAGWWAQIGEQELLHDPRMAQWEQLGWKIEDLTAPWSFLWGGNFSVPRQSLLEVGGFDDTFIDWGAEDIDLGYRLHKHGLIFSVNPAAAAIHLPHTTSTRDLATEYRNKRRIYTKDPNLITELLAGCGLMQFNQELDEIRRLAELPLSPDYSQIWTADDQPVRRSLGACWIFGGGTGDLAALVDCRGIGDPDPANVERMQRRFPWLDVHCCFGVNTSIPANSVQTVLISDFWRAFSERAVRRMIEEAMRIAPQAVMLYTPSYPVPRMQSAPSWDREQLAAVAVKAGFALEERFVSGETIAFAVVRPAQQLHSGGSEHGNH